MPHDFVRRRDLLLRVGEVFSAYASGNPDHPGGFSDGGPGGDDPGEDPMPDHGIQTETGQDILTDGGLLILAENQ